ncbi:MAG: tRNA uridine-5-carboxymethylaminomethyl(34) synthesis GTPase MnmE [Clostridia bacterium]|nr:tRNA uridine-5-carboxymethylaminomethyl(34) synthesis GTPase MnmE [Clostridia bacterium]
MKEDNISAISTGLSVGGVAVIRISGPDPEDIAKKMFKPTGNIAVSDFEPNKMYTGEILCDGFTDFGLCVFFRAPKSFTGENVIEFHCHGGRAIAKGVLKKVLSLGARLADKGEFTRRAFLNGKLSLSSCEGLIDMINSETESGVKAGYYLYREKLTKEVNYLQDRLTDAVAEIDVDMDYPEEDLEVSSREHAKVILSEVVGKIDNLLSTFRTGIIIKDGVKVGIVGKPNTGKSSLLNALLNYDKAIVSDVAGTTRDVVEGAIDINGVRFNFSDTAGIRDSEDGVEKIGVSLSKKILLESDVILFVIDGSEITEEDDEIYKLLTGKNFITVVNKSDKEIVKDERADVIVSAKNKDNIDAVRDLLFDKSIGKNFDLNGDFLCEERHYLALNKARTKLYDGLQNVDALPLDLLEIDVKAGWDALGEITGKTASEEIIDNIFNRFCVGK